MRGLALEGGGARGAYHIGVIKALMENNYNFDGFVGTSIGAINAAMLAQGDFDKAFKFWSEITADKIFDCDEQLLLQLTDLRGIKPDLELPYKMTKALRKAVHGKGINTSKMRVLLEQYIDEDRLRKSGKDFGLVTLSINDLKPYKLMLGDIPRNRLINYLMASASIPGFRNEKIDGRTFVDGAFYDNCPYALLSNRGYDEIIAIRTKAPGVFRKVEDTEKVKVITSNEGLGNFILFSPESSAANISMGYCDGLNFVKNSH